MQTQEFQERYVLLIYFIFSHLCLRDAHTESITPRQAIIVLQAPDEDDDDFAEVTPQMIHRNSKCV